MKKILIIGSLNMDTVISTSHLPKPGETIIGYGISHISGGKGANQAYAIGKLGGNVSMIGAVGDDGFGKTLRANLADVNVDISGIETIHNVPSGQAFIPVEEKTGQNSIIVIPGANRFVDISFIDYNINRIKEADIIVMQLEIPLETVAYVKDIAKKSGKTLILDPAPAATDFPDTFWKGIDFIKPNETELEILTGRSLKTKDDYRMAAEQLLAKGVENVIVSLGEEGILFVKNDSTEFFPTKKVDAVDTTAAGDAFIAGFAVSLSRGKSVFESIEYGQAVAGIAVCRPGAQNSIPTAEEVKI